MSFDRYAWQNQPWDYLTNPIKYTPSIIPQIDGYKQVNGFDKPPVFSDEEMHEMHDLRQQAKIHRTTMIDSNLYIKLMDIALKSL